MNKEQQIEEIKKLVRNTYDIPYQIAETLYSNGYRKIEEGSVIFTKKEDENRMIAEVRYRKARDEEVRKETAKEIFKNLIEAERKDCFNTFIFEKSVFYELAKEYGVEIEQ